MQVLIFLILSSLAQADDGAVPCVNIDVVGEEAQSCLIVPDEGKRFVLVDFSFITCGACIENFPVLAKFAHELPENTSVNVVLFKHTNEDNLKYISNPKHAEWFDGHRVGMDQKNKQGKALGLQLAPTMWLFERGKSEPIGKWVGVLTHSEMNQIKTLVAE